MSSDSSPGSSNQSPGARSPGDSSRRGRGGWSARPPKRTWASVRKPSWLIHWRRTLLILLGVIGVVVALSFGYRQLKKLQISRLDRQALAYLKQGKTKEAQMSLQTALRLNPADAAALRLQARLQQTQGEGVAGLQAYQQLARSGKMSLGDLAPFAMLADRQGDTRLADRLAEGASKSNPFLGHLIRADLLKQRGKPADAAAELRLAIKESQGPLPAAKVPAKASEKASASGAAKAATLDPKEAEKMMTAMGDSARMALVDLLITQGGAINKGEPSKSVDEALPLLKALASRNNEAGARALATGLRSGIVPTSESAAWIKQLRSHPKVTPEMLILADAAAIQNDPTQKGVILLAMIERAKKGAPEQRLAVARLLLGMNETVRAAELLSRDEAMKSPAAFLIWMQAMEGAGKQGEILSTLDLPSNPLPSHLRDLYRAAELKSDHQTDKAEAAFRKALADHVTQGQKGQERAETLLFLNAAGEQALFEQGLQVVLAYPADAESSLNAIAAGVQRQQDSAKLLRIIELAAATPSLSGNVRVLNELAYLRLVMGQPVEMGDLVARREANPNEFAFRVTESLALIKAGKNAKALEVLESIEAHVDAAKLPARQMAALAMVMALNGDAEKANMLLAHVRADQLSRQEIALIRQSIPTSEARPPDPSIPSSPPLSLPPAETNSGGTPPTNTPLP